MDERNDEVYAKLEKAEAEIKAVCKKYGVSLGPLYDEGIAVAMRIEEDGLFYEVELNV